MNVFIALKGTHFYIFINTGTCYLEGEIGPYAEKWGVGEGQFSCMKGGC